LAVAVLVVLGFLEEAFFAMHQYNTKELILTVQPRKPRGTYHGRCAQQIFDDNPRPRKNRLKA